MNFISLSVNTVIQSIDMNTLSPRIIGLFVNKNKTTSFHLNKLCAFLDNFSVHFTSYTAVINKFPLEMSAMLPNTWPTCYLLSLYFFTQPQYFLCMFFPLKIVCLFTWRKLLIEQCSNVPFQKPREELKFPCPFDVERNRLEKLEIIRFKFEM